MRHFLSTLLLFIVITFPLAAQAQERQSWWPHVFPPQGSAAAYQLERQSRAVLPLVSLDENASVPARADAIRLFINKHSEHNIDEEFYKNWHNMPFLLERLRAQATLPPMSARHQGPPHMECATRSVAMAHVLAAAGINYRIVVIYPDEDSDRSHTFLEVHDPATQRWSIQDPDLNIIWMGPTGQYRLSTRELMQVPGPAAMENFAQPCRTPGTCGWDDPLRQMAPYFAMAVIFTPQSPQVAVLTRADEETGSSYDKTRLFRHMQLRQSYCALYAAHRCHYDPIVLEPLQLGDNPAD